jgi:acetyl-CoA synthetase
MKKKVKWIIEDPDKKNVFWPSEEMKKKAWIGDDAIYEKAYADPEKFWADLARDGLDWYKEWDKIYQWNPPYYKWFLGGKLNASVNCLDRHVETWRKHKVAIIWEPEPLDEPKKVLTYDELYREVNKFANALKKMGVKKGDTIGIYLPMIPEVQIALLACARLGAIHSVVFSAFSSQSLNQRLEDAESKVLITADGYYRRGREINLKKNADAALEGTMVKDVIVVQRMGNDVDMVSGRDHWWHELTENVEEFCEPEVMDSEDPLFILYTSGTTGRPKGIIHETGGYMTQAHWTTKWDFDIHDDDLYWCTADIGWITGHTYACYGPLSIGATMLIYEGAPNYPEPNRWWKLIEKYGVNQFYTAPTAIRMFMRWGEEWIKKHDLSTLRILGTVGEPINEEAWLWYLNVIGGGRCPIIDTWWQTETGGTLIMALPGIGPFIPTVAGRNFPGVKHIIVDETGEEVPQGEGGYLVQVSPFAPGMLRGVWKQPERYVDTYFSEYGQKIYYTSDGARQWDEMGNIRLTGRVDDVMKVAGHRLSTAEVEDALTQHNSVVECAVVSAPHAIKGEVPVAFVTLQRGMELTEQLHRELIKQVDNVIGPTARPALIIDTQELPKTRSGKIMRRVMKALVTGEELGNLTTLMNPEVVSELQKIVSDRRSEIK